MTSFHLLKGVRQGRTKQPDNQDSGSGTKRRKAMNAAKVTLTSTILAAALGLALGLAAAPAEAHHSGGHNKGGGGDGEDPIVYTAQLTAGAFVFAPVNPVPVTPNQRENVLRSGVDLNFDIETSPESGTWFDMFDTCKDLWEPGPVEAFFVGEDDWSIHEAGGVRVVFRHIEDQGAEFRFQLIGSQFEFIDSFLPELDEVREYVLTEFAITAKSLAGGSGGTKFCRTLGGEFGDPLLLTEPSTLVITAPE